MHTEAVASFGERISDRETNLANACGAVAEFNARDARGVRVARTIVHKHHGSFVFDNWIEYCTRLQRRQPSPPKRKPRMPLLPHQRGTGPYGL